MFSFYCKTINKVVSFIPYLNKLRKISELGRATRNHSVDHVLDRTAVKALKMSINPIHFLKLIEL